MVSLSASISLEITESSIFERFIALYAGIGCQSLQGIWRKPIEIEAREVVRTANAAGLSFDSVHGSFGEEFDISTPLENIRLQTILAHEQDAELAGALGGSLVVVHPSCCIPDEIGLLWARRHKLGNPLEGGAGGSWGAAVDHAREPLLLDSLEKLADIGEEMEIVFALENVPGYLWYGHHAERLATLIRQIDSPYLQMCFDLGHAQLEAAHFGSVASQLTACLDVVGYVHVHDNDGLHDSHLVPGADGGVINWEEIGAVVRDAPSDLVWMLELFGEVNELEKSLRDNVVARDLLERLFDRP